MGVQLPSEPITRKEQYLAKAAGQAVEIPAEPITREEAYLEAIANAGGGGGGTTNYNQLSNKPQIAGTTLQGNKTLSELGIASESALANKVDKVNGKELSTNDYDDTEKAAVSAATTAIAGIKDGTTIDSFADVETALAGKQGTLTAGDYINLNNGNISVNRNLVVDNYLYTIGTNDAYYITVTKSQGGEIISTNTYSYSRGTVTNVDGNFTITHDYDNRLGYVWVYTSLKDSAEHTAGYTWTKAVTDTPFSVDEAFPSEDVSGYKIVIKSEMDTALSGKQDTLTFDNAPTENSNNPVKSNGIYDALALKQNATDNSLDTTAKTIVGAINEHEGDVSTLKSGLTNLDNEVNGDATVYPYADVITIPDAVPANVADCNVKIEPVQDMHGYDKPWVGGAGKNIAEPVITTSTTISAIPFDVIKDADNNILGVSIGSGTTNDVVNEHLVEFTCVEGGTYKVIGAKLNGTTSVNHYRTFVYDLTTASAVIHKIDYDETTVTLETGHEYTIAVYFSSGVTVEATTLQIMICKASESSTFAPYTNICPITGHTEASVQRDGKNELDIATVFAGTSMYNVNADGTLTQTASDNRAEGVMITQHLRAGSYYFDRGVQTAGGLYVYANDGGQWVQFINNKSAGSVPFTLDKDYDLYIKMSMMSAGDYPITFHPMIRLATEDATWEPYAGKTYTIALGDTIYGGTVDFDSGVMTVTHKMVEFDGSEDEAWILQPNRNRVWTRKIEIVIKKPSASGVVADIMSDKYPANSSTNTYNGKIGISVNTAGYIEVADGVGNMDLSAWTTALSNSPLQVCYELATPTTIQLAPKQIQLLKGTNTLTASTGQISVTANGVSGSIGAVQEQVNELADSVDEDFIDIVGYIKRKNVFNPYSTLMLGFGSTTIGNTGIFVEGSYGAYVFKAEALKYVLSGVNFSNVYDSAIRVFLSNEYPAVGVSFYRADNLSSNTAFNTNGYKYVCFLIQWTGGTTLGDKQAIQVEAGSVATTHENYKEVLDVLLDRVPYPPTTNGTYSLQVTVASGVPTYSWVSNA